MQSVLTEDFEILSQSNLAFEQFRDKKILITGATGLIGSLLVKTFFILQSCASIKYESLCTGS